MKFLLYYLCFSSNLVLSRVCSIGRDVYMYCKLSIKIFGTMKNKKHTKRRKKTETNRHSNGPKYIYNRIYWMIGEKIRRARNITLTTLTSCVHCMCRYRTYLYEYLYGRTKCERYSPSLPIIVQANKKPNQTQRNRMND